MSGYIFITGATGNVGREVVRHLLGKNINITAARSRHKFKPEENCTYKAFDFTDRKTWNTCLEGVDRVFLMRPPHISNIRRDMYPFLEYLKEIDIRQVVFLSVQGVENNKVVPHYKVEKYLRELDIPCTFIRPSFFMQNLTTTHLDEIRDENRLFIPAGEGKTNFVDIRDIGEIIALMFTDKKHINQAYTITGEMSYSYGEVAELLSEVSGKEISYTDPGPIQFLTYHIKKRRKLPMTLVMLALYTVVKTGKGDISTNETAEILGRAPRNLRDFITDNRELLFS